MWCSVSLQAGFVTLNRCRKRRKPDEKYSDGTEAISSDIAASRQGPAGEIGVHLRDGSVSVVSCFDDRRGGRDFGVRVVRRHRGAESGRRHMVLAADRGQVDCSGRGRERGPDPSMRYPTWNPVLFQPKSGPLMLFYKVGPSPSAWWGMVMSLENGRELVPVAPAARWRLGAHQE